MRFLFLAELLFLPVQYKVENKVPPRFEVVNKVAPQSAPVPTRANGYILRQYWDGRTWQQWWEPEGGSQTARPFSQTPAVQVSPSTNITTVPPAASNLPLVGQRGYRAATSGGIIYMSAPGVGSNGSIENCGPLG